MARAPFPEVYNGLKERLERESKPEVTTDITKAAPISSHMYAEINISLKKPDWPVHRGRVEK